MKILSVEAWAEGSEDEMSWTWNSWNKVGETEIACETEGDAMDEFEKFFNRQIDTEKYCIIDDQYNFTLCVIADDYRPIFAIAYGEEV